MKKLSTESKIFFAALALIVFMGAFQYVPWWFNEELPIRKKETEKKKKDYSSLEILKYNADTLEIVFHSPRVRREFNSEWKLRNGGHSVQEAPVSENMQVLKYNGDTIQIKFQNAGFQRQFERQWRRYNGHKLNNVYQNTKHK